MLAENFRADPRGFDSLDDSLKRIDQLEDSDFAQTQTERSEGCWRTGRSRENICSCSELRATCRLRRRFLELLVFDQLPDQFPARIVLFGIFLRRLLIDRQQAAALQINQIRRHDDEFAGDRRCSIP